MEVGGTYKRVFDEHDILWMTLQRQKTTSNILTIVIKGDRRVHLGPDSFGYFIFI